MQTTEHPHFPAHPRSVEQALRNLLALAGELPGHWPHYDMQLIRVACYGPYYRWDRRREEYRLHIRPWNRDRWYAERYAGRAMTDSVVAVLGTWEPTVEQVRAALAHRTQEDGEALQTTESTKAWCIERNHPWVTYNPWLGRSYCRCGARQAAGSQPTDWKAKHDIFHNHPPGAPCRCYTVGKPS